MLKTNTRGIVKHLSPFRKLILLVLLALGSMLLFMLGGWLIAFLIYDDFITLMMQLENFEEERVVSLLKYFQIVNQLGLFIFPPLLFAWLDGGNVFPYLRLNRRPNLQIALLSIVLVFAVLPLVHWSATVNEMLVLPEWLKSVETWMKQSEENASRITEAFLNVNSISGFVLNLVMIAVLPAIGEELLFRGVVQKLMHQWFRNVHVAIVVTAVIFSALHLQFYGFLPRTLLGIMFGYLFVITGSLWVPVLAHFINNGAAVVAAFLFRQELLESDYQEVGKVNDPEWVVVSLIVVIIIFLVIKGLSMRNEADEIG